MDDFLSGHHHDSEPMGVFAQLAPEGGRHHHVKLLVGAPCVPVVVAWEYSFDTCRERKQTLGGRGLPFRWPGGAHGFSLWARVYDYMKRIVSSSV